jgi:predicted Zn-dependent protease
MEVMTAIVAAAMLMLQQSPAPGSVNLYNLEREEALGSRLSADFRKRNPVLEDVRVTAFVERTGQRLAAAMPGHAVRWTFTVVAGDAESNELREPVTFPGGYVFVSFELLTRSTNESEFAAMLAHAMAHVAARHGTRYVTRTQLMHVASIPLIYMGHVGRALVPMQMVQQAKAFESEADRIAVSALAAACYDPTALRTYVDRYSPETVAPNSPLPDRNMRLEAINQAIQGTTRSLCPAQTDSVYIEAREVVRSITARPAPSLRK